MKILQLGLEVAGFAALVVAGFLVSPAVGLLILGAGLVVAGNVKL